MLLFFCEFITQVMARKTCVFLIYLNICIRIQVRNGTGTGILTGEKFLVILHNKQFDRYPLTAL